MPVSRSEFESGQILTELEKSIICFLEKNRTRAFTPNEIMNGINFQANFSTLVAALLSGLGILGFPMILNDLTTKGKIRTNIIQGQYYFMAK